MLLRPSSCFFLKSSSNRVISFVRSCFDRCTGLWISIWTVSGMKMSESRFRRRSSQVKNDKVWKDKNSLRRTNVGTVVIKKECDEREKRRGGKAGGDDSKIKEGVG